MSGNGEVRLTWRGAAHYQIKYNDLKIVLDPLYTRLPGDLPHLSARKEDAEQMDYLLLTHGHLDHSWDFPYLLFKHRPTAYAPDTFIAKLKKKNGPDQPNFDFSTCHSLEKIVGERLRVGDIEVTPYQIGTEEIDFWFIRSMCLRPWVNGNVKSIPVGLRWMFHNLFGNCFAYLFRLPPHQKTMLFFGNLTDRVDGLDGINRVNVLAIPYCPANNKWKQQSIFLIKRFSPDVTLVHHYDNFMNPYTLSKYLEMTDYQAAISNACPDVRLFFSKFDEEVTFRSVAEVV